MAQIDDPSAITNTHSAVCEYPFSKTHCRAETEGDYLPTPIPVSSRVWKKTHSLVRYPAVYTGNFYEITSGKKWVFRLMSIFQSDTNSEIKKGRLHASPLSVRYAFGIYPASTSGLTLNTFVPLSSNNSVRYEASEGS
jgi:hypothetical protein